MKRISRRLALLLLLGALFLRGAAGEAAPVESLTAEDLSATPVGQAALRTEQALSLHIQDLYDDYAYYYTTEEFTTILEDYEGTFGGVGISMINNADGNIEVYAVLDDGPAHDTEIQPGDIILSADGENLLGCDSALAVTKIRGEIGQSVTLGLRRPDGTEYQVTLVRQEITSESVEGELFEEVPGTAYIYVYDFTEQTTGEFIQTYNELQQEETLDTIILDLRSNGGGSLNAAIGIANLFVPAGECILQEKTEAGMIEYTANDGQLHGTELVILMNEYSASASEVLAGALRDQAGAVLIGATSYGKGVTQTIASLRSGGGIRYTRSHYYLPSGYDLHKVGLVPDVTVELPEDIQREEYWSTDPALNPDLAAARDYLLQ